MPYRPKPAGAFVSVGVPKSAVHRATIRCVLFGPDYQELDWQSQPSQKDPQFRAKLPDGRYWTYLRITYPGHEAHIDLSEFEVVDQRTHRRLRLVSDGWFPLPFSNADRKKVPSDLLAAIEAWDKASHTHA